MNYKELGKLLFPNIDKDISYYENIYPERVNKGNFVTRFGPSPTGFIHMGSLYVSFISEMFARKNNGTFYLRIEDTDQKRKVENGIKNIIEALKQFDFNIDEGPIIGGNYGPYIQSERKDIYACFAKYLVENDLAYPCFCSKEELDNIRKEQEKNKERIGYYGKWAKHRNLTFEEIKEKINNNEPYVIRLKSNGDFNKKIEIKDLIKGEITFPENDLDIVLIKSDGLPTYHFAHVIDDHLMRTTHVIRGDEWLSSLPIHYQLFRLLNFKVPKYAHIAPITKRENNTVRKLSKRYDPECSIDFYYEKGFPIQVIKIYLASLINADFEVWYNNHLQEDLSNFDFSFKKMSVGGALFDYEKLVNIAKTYFSNLKAEEIYNGLIDYSSKYDKDLNKILCNNKKYTISILNIERNKKRPRKDIYCYKSFKELFWYMFDEYYDLKNDKELYNNISNIKNIKNLLEDFISDYNENDYEDIWFEKIKKICLKYNYASTVKDYKDNPDIYNGHVGDICNIIRNIVTSSNESPNLYEILKVLGKERLNKRINRFMKYQKELEK